MTNAKSDKAAYDRITKKIQDGSIIVVVIPVKKTA